MVNLQGTSTAVPPVNQFDGMRQQLLETMDLYKKNPNPDLQNELKCIIFELGFKYVLFYYLQVLKLF